MPPENVIFEYQPLPEQPHIRLLDKLSPADDGMLCFRLVTEEFRQGNLNYYCLSYTWSNPFAHGVGFAEAYNNAEVEYSSSNLVKVLVNNKPMYIQRNLHAALSTLPDNTFQDFVSSLIDNKTGSSHIHISAATGNKTSLILRLGLGIDVNVADDEGNTAMHYAAANNQLDITHLLISFGGDIDATNDFGDSAIDIAQKKGFKRVKWRLENHDAIEKTTFKLDLKPPSIWIDAISINQKDNAEKSSQVNMMERIYSMASYAVAWLGPTDANSERGINTLHKLVQHSTEFNSSKIIPFAFNSDKKFKACGIPPITLEDWNGLASVFQRQWFRRLWIIQEAVLGKALLVYIGELLLHWHHLGDVAHIIEKQEAKLGTFASVRYSPGHDVAVSVIWNMAQIYATRHKAAGSSNRDEYDDRHQHFELDGLLRASRTFFATDPRDNVFSCYMLRSGQHIFQN